MYGLNRIYIFRVHSGWQLLTPHPGRGQKVNFEFLNFSRLR
ncbi:unnamed protein product, partial [Larinioides sclopetarius]